MFTDISENKVMKFKGLKWMFKPWYSKTVSYLFGTWVQIHSICLCYCTAVCRFQQVNVPSCSESNAKNLLPSHFHYRCRLVLNLEGKDSLRFKSMRLGDVSVAFVSAQKQNTAPYAYGFLHILHIEPIFYGWWSTHITSSSQLASELKCLSSAPVSSMPEYLRSSLAIC